MRTEWARKMEADLEERTQWALALKQEKETAVADFERAVAESENSRRHIQALEKELADAKVRYRSNFYGQVESSFGKTHLLSALALFRDDPQQINSLLTPFENVTAAQIKSAAAKYLVATNRTAIDRVPEAKPQPKTGQ